MTRLWPQGILVTVFTTQAGTPQVFLWADTVHQVAEISRQWLVNWREEGDLVRRIYYKLRTDTGLLVVIYQNVATGQWVLQRLYD